MKTVVLDVYDTYMHPDLYKFVFDLYGGESDADNALNMFEGDPDLIRIDGTQTMFVDVIANDTRFVLYLDKLEGIENALSDFFADNYKERFKGNENAQSWDDFNKSDNAIAYRGGKGHNYAIYTFN